MFLSGRWSSSPICPERQGWSLLIHSWWARLDTKAGGATLGGDGSFHRESNNGWLSHDKSLWNLRVAINLLHLWTTEPEIYLFYIFKLYKYLIAGFLCFQLGNGFWTHWFSGAILGVTPGMPVVEPGLGGYKASALTPVLISLVPVYFLFNLVFQFSI